MLRKDLPPGEVVLVLCIPMFLGAALAPRFPVLGFSMLGLGAISFIIAFICYAKNGK